MARVTVEDCVLRIPNRFELVMLSAQRARDISAGAPLTVDRDNDKNPVVALREIADETVNLDDLREALIRGLQKHAELEEPEEELTDLMSAEEIASLAAAEEGEGEEEKAAGEAEAEGEDEPAADEEVAEDELTSEEEDVSPEEGSEEEKA